MDDIIASQMSLNVKNLTDSADVVSSSDVSKVSGFIFVPFDNLVLFQIELDCISFGDIRVGESDGPAVVGDDIWNFVGSNSSSLDLEKFSFGLYFFKFDQGESSLDIIEESVALSGLGDGNNIHNTDWEFDVSSGSIVHFDSSLFVLDDDVGFTAVKCNLKMVST